MYIINSCIEQYNQEVTMRSEFLYKEFVPSLSMFKIWASIWLNKHARFNSLKKTKAGEQVDMTPYSPKTKGLENPRNQHEHDSDREVEVNEPIDLSENMPKTKGLENPRNMNEYYKYLYKKVKGLD